MKNVIISMTAPHFVSGTNLFLDNPVLWQPDVRAEGKGFGRFLDAFKFDLKSWLAVAPK